MGVASMIVKGVGGFIKTFGDVQSSQAEMQIAQQNQNIAMNKATQAQMIGSARASAKIGEGTQRIGVISTGAAAANVDVEKSGSVTRAIEGSRVMNARDILAMKFNTDNDTFGYLMKARDENIKVQQAKLKGTLAPFENLLGVASSSIGGLDTFDVGGGPDTGGGRTGIEQDMGDYGDYGDLGFGYGAGD